MASKGIAAWRSGRMVNGVMTELPTLVRLGRGAQWPTPRSSAQEARTLRRTPSQAAGKHGLYLSAEVCEVEAAEGRVRGPLNPVWVEWLMGYPQGWTEL